MTDLSPAGQAVLRAYRDSSWTPDKEDNGKYYKFSHKAGIAAALRAAAIYCTREQRILMTIADELEGVTYGTYRCDLEAQ
jgi:hypothetical protein